MNHPHPVALQAQERPHALALSDERGRMTWAELWSSVQADARLLRETIQPSQRLFAMQPAADRETIIRLHACTLLGLRVLLVDPRATADELAQLFDLYAPDGILSSGGSALQENAEDAKLRPETAESLTCGASTKAAFLLLTSGTTGVPKAVPLTAHQFAVHAKATAQHLGLSAEDRWLMCLPPHHVGGLSIILRAACLGSGVVLRAGFVAEEVNLLIDGGEVSHISVVPTMLKRLIAARDGKSFPKSLQTLLVGGAALHPELAWQAAVLHAPLAITYGLSEACSQVATLRVSEFRQGKRSCGLPLPGVRISIRDDGGKPVADGVIGEIYVGGETVMSGYEGDVRGHAGEWFATGDFGTMRAGEGLSIVDRRSDLIVSGGENVYPREVEDCLLAHASVEAAAVVGVPDAEWGQRVVAAVVLRHPCAPGELQAWCRERLSRAKIPAEIRVVNQLQGSERGKIRRIEVRRQWLAEDLAAEPTLCGETLQVTQW
jgi:o-succinylbenzoate---CoA ligase